MGEWKVQMSFRVRMDLRTELMAFAEREKRTVGNLGVVLLEWGLEQLKSAGSTNALFERENKRINENNPGRRVQSA